MKERNHKHETFVVSVFQIHRKQRDFRNLSYLTMLYSC